MASLNTLRTKFGIVLSIIIALALLAFILSLKTEMGFSGNDPRVGVIDGEKINYSEYYDQYEQIKAQSGVQENDEQQAAMLANATWQSLISKYVMTPGFERLGLRVTEPERMAMISGEQPSQTLYNAFADPRTGTYNVAAISDFLAQAETNPQAAQAWTQLNEQARAEREMQKYFGLIRGGHVDACFLGALEVDAQGNLANWIIPGKKMPGMGGAMDLCVGAKHCIVCMEHTAKGNPKIFEKCRLPLTASHCVNKIITEMCVFEVTDKGLLMTEINPEFTVDQIKEATAAPFEVAVDLKSMLD